MRYFEKDLKTGRTFLDESGQVRKVVPSREDSLDKLMENGVWQFAGGESVEDTVFRKISVEELYRAMRHLRPADHALVIALFFEGKTEREYAEELGVYRNTVHKRKMRILTELKKILE